MPQATGSWAQGHPRPCREHFLPGLHTSQQGSVPGNDSTALGLRTGRQASTKMHTCVGSGAMEQGLENIGPCLSEGTETQYSSAQTELGCGPHYPVLKSSLAMSLIPPPCPETPGPRGPHRALQFLLVAFLQGQSELTSPGPSVPCKGAGGTQCQSPEGNSAGNQSKDRH